MEPVTLRYQLDPGELAAAGFDHGPTARLAANRQKLLGAAGILLGAVTLGSGPTALAPLLVGALIFGLGTRWSIVRRSRWVYARTPSLTDAVSVAADERGVRITNATSDLWYDWANYASVESTPTGVALVTRGGTTVRWVPARAFADAGQQAAWFVQARDGIARSGSTDTSRSG